MRSERWKWAPAAATLLGAALAGPAAGQYGARLPVAPADSAVRKVSFWKTPLEETASPPATGPEVLPPPRTIEPPAAPAGPFLPPESTWAPGVGPSVPPGPAE